MFLYISLVVFIASCWGAKSIIDAENLPSYSTFDISEWPPLTADIEPSPTYSNEFVQFDFESFRANLPRVIDGVWISSSLDGSMFELERSDAVEQSSVFSANILAMNETYARSMYA
jgi:hypothetical protein